MAGREAAHLGFAPQLLPVLLAQQRFHARLPQRLQQLMQFGCGAMARIPIPQGGLLLQQLLEVGRWQQQHRGGAGGAQLLAGGLAQQAAPARRIARLQNFQSVQLPVDRVDR